MKRLTPLLAVFLLLVTATPAHATPQAVSVGDSFFNPTTKTIARGDTVKWTSGGFQNHTVTSGAPLNWSGSLPGKGATYTTPLALVAAGTYPYFCQIHSSQGMKGKIQVPLSLASRVGTTIKLTVASAPAATGFKYVVQRKNGTGFVTIGSVTTTTFEFKNAPAGQNIFRAALQKGSTAPSATSFSLPLTVN